MPYTASPNEVKSFEVEREVIAKKLDLGHEILWLTREECVKVGPSIQETLELTRGALIAHGTGAYEMPAKIGIHPFDDVFFHAMPAYVPSSSACGMKWIECFPQNPKKYGLPQTTGLLVLNDILSGVPIAVMDSTWLTAMRTPAVTALMAAKLHPGARTFGMFGCGVQGIEHVKYAAAALSHLEEIYIYDVRPEAMDRAVAEVAPYVRNVRVIKASSPKDLVDHCEVMSSATFIVREPQSLVKAEWIRKGQTILPCDLNTFWAPEIPWKASKYIVDSLQEHQLFADMGYFPDGLPTVYAQSGEVLADSVRGRTAADEVIVCSNIGISVCDVVMGQRILANALKKSVGRVLPL